MISSRRAGAEPPGMVPVYSSPTAGFRRRTRAARIVANADTTASYRGRKYLVKYLEFRVIAENRGARACAAAACGRQHVHM
jgi:hypothetical protein